MTVMIQIASAEEWAATRLIVGNAGTMLERGPFGEYFPHLLGRRECLFHHSGPTKTRAAAACQYAIDRWRPAGVIVLGTCGGVAADLAAGDILLADRTVQYDCLERMDPDGELFYQPMTTHPDPSWLTSGVPGAWRVGTIGTADQDLSPEQLVPLRRAGVLGVDWESGAVAKVCELNGIRCAVLRGVSDWGGAAMAEDYRRHTPRVMRRLLDLAAELLERGMTWQS